MEEVKTKKLLVPKLRFQGFEDSWHENKLGQLAKVASGGTPSRSKNKYWGGNIPWVTTSLINFNVIQNAEEFITEEGIENSSAKLFPRGTLLMAMYGQGKTRGKIGILGIEASTNQACGAIIPNQHVNNEYLFQNLSGRYDEIRRLSNDGGQQNISGGIIKGLKLKYPSFPEQQKIASFLTTVDKKIAQLTKKTQLLAQYKKGVMQQLFAQKLRFKDVHGNSYPDWEEKRLGEVVDYEQPTKYLVSSTEYDDSFKTPVLTAGKTFLLGYTNEIENLFNNKLPVIIFDDFTTATQFVDFPFKAKSSAMKILTAKDDENIKFIYEVMQMIRFEVGGHGRHWISKYARMKIKFPCLQEQTQIAQFLSSIDAKIELANTQLKNAQQFKKGLLQQMFI